MLSINTNLSSLIAQNSMKSSTDKLNLAVERMTTGFKLNHSSDNAANYSISTNMTTKIGAYQVAEDNTAMGLDMVTTASDTISEMQSHAERLRALAVQARNGTYGSQSLNAMQEEANAIYDEINRLYSTAQYNGISLFNQKEYELPDGMPVYGKNKFIDANAITAERAIIEGEFLNEINKISKSDMQKMEKVSEVDSFVSNNEYLIEDYKDLEKLSKLVKNGLDTSGVIFVLANDINLEGVDDFESIGTSSNAFKGVFNGNGNVISNLDIQKSTESYVGLFGYLSGDAKVENLGVENASINALSNVGILVGKITSNVSINNCFVSGTVLASGSSVGGFIGDSDGLITNSYAYSTVDNKSTAKYTGGLVGRTGAGVVKNCFSETMLSTLGESSGGLIGGNLGAEVENCYSVCDINGKKNIGGLIGVSARSLEYLNCYAKGDIRGTYCLGGLIGNGAQLSVESSFASVNVLSAYAFIGGLIGQTAEVTIKNCYVDGSIKAGYSDVGGIIGRILSGNSTIKNTNFLGEMSNPNKHSSFIGTIRVTTDDVTYYTTNIENCAVKSSDLKKIGQCTDSSYVKIDDYDINSWTNKIKDINSLSTDTILQVGISNNISSQIVFNSNFNFDIISTYDIRINSEKALSSIDDFTNMLSSKQTELGAVQNRLESALDEISTQYENLVSARSTLRDADIAEVSSHYIQQQILQQASATLMATANQSPVIALQLI